eukprot:TRINITY_DN27135_c0_g1_i1.p1 TRINITY_DN27135_c0_g1~~TRINITY_DN27135_c0_g1_i1.p1  ORF type:complete len:189 (+),score=107.13 TRINITY_DN27135_c0_g1_i1:131-697(+)
MGMDAADLVIGKKVTIKTTTSEEFDGVIYGVDRDQNCLALFELGSMNAARQAFRMFNLSYVEEVKEFSGDDTPLGDHFKPNAELPKIPTDKLKQKVEEQRAERKKKIGHDVTIEAQDVFDYIAKTLPCEWDKDTIVIFDIVTLSSPYTPNALAAKEGGHGGDRAKATLEQVKKILSDRQRKEEQKKGN